MSEARRGALVKELCSLMDEKTALDIELGRRRMLARLSTPEAVLNTCLNLTGTRLIFRDGQGGGDPSAEDQVGVLATFQPSYKGQYKESFYVDLVQDDGGRRLKVKGYDMPDSADVAAMAQTHLQREDLEAGLVGFVQEAWRLVWSFVQRGGQIEEVRRENNFTRFQSGPLRASPDRCQVFVTTEMCEEQNRKDHRVTIGLTYGKEEVLPSGIKVTTDSPIPKGLMEMFQRDLKVLQEKPLLEGLVSIFTKGESMDTTDSRMTSGTEKPSQTF